MPDQPDLATALAKHLCEIDACSDPAPCFDHLTAAGVALKFLGNVAPAPIVLSLPPLSDAATADLKSRFMEQVLKYRYTVLPATADERVAAAYRRGLAAGQAERDQLRRLHEATEAALEHAEQYARDLQDNLAVVDSPALGVSRLVGRWETADEPCCDLSAMQPEEAGRGQA